MHRQLRESMQDAEGFSDLVVVIFLDVRGFSNFAGMAESTEAAIFLRRMYLEIIDNYFPESAFFKPTGDGLMIVRHFDRATLTSEVETSIATALDLVEAFPEISAADPMVNFEVPKALGIGIARGAATRLASGDLTLDYSGRPLNLAARLMDLARPRGVVFDSRLVKGVDIDEELLEQFTMCDVYLKGIADRTPIQVYSSSEVSIPPRNRRPLDGVPYETTIGTVKFKEIASRGPRFIHKVRAEPVDPDEIELVVICPKPTSSGAKSKNMSMQHSFKPVSTRKGANGWEASFDYLAVTEALKDAGVKSTWDVRQRLRYMATGIGDSSA